MGIDMFKVNLVSITLESHCKQAQIFHPPDNNESSSNLCCYIVGSGSPSKTRYIPMSSTFLLTVVCGSPEGNVMSLRWKIVLPHCTP